MRKMTWLKRTAINLSVLLAAMLLFFACFEIAVRVLHVSTGYDYPKGMYEADDLLDTRLAPDFKGEFIKSEFRTEIFTNSFGMFDVEYKEKAPGELRVLALGDSFTWGGYGTGLNETFLKVLERKLDDSSPLDIRVMNAGVPGYGTDQAYLYLVNKSAMLEPDIVLLNLFIGNDFTDNLRAGEYAVKDGFRVSGDPGEVTFANKVRSLLLMKFHSYRIIERSLLNVFGPFIQKNVRDKFQADEEQVFLFQEGLRGSEEWNRTENLLRDLKGYTRANDMEFFIALIPLKYQVDDGLKEIFITNNGLDEDSLDMDLPQELVIDWGTRNSVQVIDLLPGFREENFDNSLYWEFNPHFNKAGNDLAGEIIFDGMRLSTLFQPDKSASPAVFGILRGREDSDIH